MFNVDFAEESNQGIFREQQLSTMRIKLTLVSSLFSWVLVDTGWPISFVDFISSLHFLRDLWFLEEDTQHTHQTKDQTY